MKTVQLQEGSASLHRGKCKYKQLKQGTKSNSDNLIWTKSNSVLNYIYVLNKIVVYIVDIAAPLQNSESMLSFKNFYFEN